MPANYQHKLQIIGGLKSDDSARTLEGWASRYGEVDAAGDIVMPGAFSKSLQKRNGDPIPSLWQHKRDMPIGTLDAQERPEGLWIKIKFDNTMWADEAYKSAKAGSVKGLSIGYDALKTSKDPLVKARNGAPATRLEEIELHEVSPVTFPCLDTARIVSVKSAFGDEWVTAMESKATPGQVAVGDFVSWGDGDAPSIGKIQYLYDAPADNLPPDAAPTPAAPWITVQVYATAPDGTVQPTETNVELPLLDVVPMEKGAQGPASGPGDTDVNPAETSAAADSSGTIPAAPDMEDPLVVLDSILTHMDGLTTGFRAFRAILAGASGEEATEPAPPAETPAPQGQGANSPGMGAPPYITGASAPPHAGKNAAMEQVKGLMGSVKSARESAILTDGFRRIADLLQTTTVRA